MRGLDAEERYVLDVIARRDVDAEVGDGEAVLRCSLRSLYAMVLEWCPACGEVHELPVLTVEGKTAIACDDALRTLEL